MIDDDLAEMYNVETRRLNEQVKRNIKRFPKDFMFTITQKEFESLKSQNATSSWGGRRKLPNAFTEQGIAMLSSILNSDTAIEVNIRIIRMEKQVKGNSKDIENIFMVLKELLEKERKPILRSKIGFNQ